MKERLMMPQEIEVFYILPAIRKEMAMAMKAAGRKQKEIAKLLCVEESTISQYMNDKRAARLKLDEKVREEAGKSAGRVNDRAGFIRETQKLLELERKRTLCARFNVIARNRKK